MIPTAIAVSIFLGVPSSYLSLQAQTDADAVVSQLRELPTPLPATGPSDGRIPAIELRRRELYRQLWLLGADALPALAKGLSDPDVRLRRNVALVLNVHRPGCKRSPACIA
jgi:hypothetical protein